MTHTDVVETPQETAEGLRDQESAEALATTINPVQDIQEPETAEAETSEPPLPPNFTEAPQHSEHMDLRKVKGHRKWVRAYQKVTDDDGDLLGDKKLEKEVIETCKELSAMDLEAVENPDALIQKVKGVIDRYQKSVNLSENTSVGIITKYRIRMGMLFNALKVLVRKKMGLLWTVWFKKNFGDSQFRSAEDYMRIAEVPNVIRHATFGKERLIAILPHIKGRTGEDPILDFLSEHGIDYDPESPSEAAEIRVQVDITIGKVRLAKEGLTAIPPDMVEAFVKSGNELEPRHVRALKAAKDAGQDVVAEMAKLLSSGGKVARQTDSSPEAKAENFRKALEKVLDLAKDALVDADYLKGVSIAHFRALRYKLRDLERKVAEISMPN
jgi:hypothetical protein